MSWAASRPAFTLFIFCAVVRESRVEVSDGHPGHAPSSSVVSACACCQACRSPSPQLRNIRRSAGSGCDCAAMTASSSRSGSKPKMVGSDRAVSPATRGLCTESERQQEKRKDRKRTYGCPVLEKASTKRRKKAIFSASAGVISHSFSNFSPSAGDL